MPKKGIIISEISRQPTERNFASCGRMQTTDTLEVARSEAYASAAIISPMFHGRVDITLDAAEIRMLNRLETKIVERMQREVIEQ
jgi:hypothetical protein